MLVAVEQSHLDKLMGELMDLKKFVRSQGVSEKPMTTKEAASFLGVHEDTLYRRIVKGTIPCHRTDGTYYFFASELVESIKKPKR